MTPLTETQRLARDVDRRLAALPRARWGELLEDAAVVLDGQWAGVSEDGKPACPDCGRHQAYGHVCSCPNRRIAKKLGPLLYEREVAAEVARRIAALPAVVEPTDDWREVLEGL